MVPYHTIILAVIVWKFFTLLLAAIATKILPLVIAFTPWRDPQYANVGLNLPYLVNIWANFDGFFYLAIARDGYLTSQQPFFPLYPLAIRALVNVTGLPHLIAAQVISVSAFLVALIVVAKLLIVDKKPNLLPWVLVAVLTYPTSYSYGAVYNDALFFLLASCCLYLGRTRRFFWAGLAGAGATLTRLNGLALFVYLIVEWYQSTPSHKDVRRIISSLFIPAAFFGYISWVHRTFGSWQTLFGSMSVWGQDKVTFPLQVFWRYLKIFLHYPPATMPYWVAVVEFSIVILYIALILWAFRKIRFSYWIFFVVSILIPSFTGTFAGMPRYGLHLYPMFLTIGMLLSGWNRTKRTLYILVTLGLLFFCVVLFTRGVFIA